MLESFRGAASIATIRKNLTLAREFALGEQAMYSAWRSTFAPRPPLPPCNENSYYPGLDACLEPCYALSGDAYSACLNSEAVTSCEEASVGYLDGDGS